MVSKYKSKRIQYSRKLKIHTRKIYKDKARLISLAKIMDKKEVNHHNYPEYYSRELFGYISLRPFRHYEGKQSEIKDKENEKDKRKDGEPYMTLKGTEPFDINEDPIEFVKKFLTAYASQNEVESKKTIYNTFVKLIKNDVFRKCPHDAPQKDPDDIIESFITHMAEWEHLAKNCNDTRKRAYKVYSYGNIKSETVALEEATSS